MCKKWKGESSERMVLAIIGITLACMFVLAWNWHDFLVWLCYWC